MAKANQRFRSSREGKTVHPHSQYGEYKIPLEDRKAFMGNNRQKWVNEKKYKQYLRWKNEG